MGKLSNVFYSPPRRWVNKRLIRLGIQPGTPKHQLLQYKAEGWWGDFIKTVLLFSTALVISLQFFWQVALMVVLNVPLHFFSRGLHLKRFIPCLLLGSANYMFGAALSMRIAISLPVSLAAFLFAGLAIILYAPADGRHASPRLLRIVWGAALVVFVLYAALFALFAYVGLNWFATALAFTVASQGVFLLPITFRMAGQQHPRKGASIWKPGKI